MDQAVPRVTFRLTKIGVAGVPDRDLGPPHRNVRPPQRRQDLLVHRIRPPHALAHRKQPDMVHHRLPTIAVRPRIARAADYIRGREVIDPDEIEDTGPELAGDLPRAVGAARIDHHNLVEQPGHG